jgi:MoxR-like ATPase
MRARIHVVVQAALLRGDRPVNTVALDPGAKESALMSLAAPQETPLEEWRSRALDLETHVAGVVLGQRDLIRLVTIAVFARGHVLLKGDVGVGKTTLLRAYSRLIGGAFARIEGTVDLMPNDLIYYTHIGRDGRPAIDPGPLLEHGEDLAILFFNEINRARPQVHALLLRAMAERSVNAFNREYRFPNLLVFADRNRLEREETFEMAAAALDRFMFELPMDTPTDKKVLLSLMGDPRFHDVDTLLQALPHGAVAHRELNVVATRVQEQILTQPALLDYALRLWEATRRPAEQGVTLEDIDTRDLMLAGASPRGMSMLLRAARVAAWLDGRDFATPEDVQRVFMPVVAHRLCFQPIYELRGADIAPRLTRAILDRIPAP